MAEIIRMPRLSDTMEEGVIIGWQKKVGDSIAPGDILAEVETDKATMDLESFDQGTLLHIAIEKGSVPVDGVIAIIGEKDEDIEKILNEVATHIPSSQNSTSIQEQADSRPKVSTPDINHTDTPTNQRIKASPLAKKLALETGLDLSQISGTGENGRIIKRDVEAARDSQSTQQPVSPQYTSLGYQDNKLSQMRKTIARRLGESKFSAPHFYLTMKIDMTEAVAARKQVNEMLAPAKISFNDMIVKACAVALKKHPEINSSWLDDRIRTNYDVHIGVAVAVTEGLVVPVIHHTDKKSLSEIGNEVRDKATRAKERKLGMDEMQGNTFTISNLGMFGIEEFTAIINPPDACILATGIIEKQPVVMDNDSIEIRHIMKVTLSCDHRVVDGAMGAQFLQTLKVLLESPVRMLA